MTAIRDELFRSAAWTGWLEARTADSDEPVFAELLIKERRMLAAAERGCSRAGFSPVQIEAIKQAGAASGLPLNHANVQDQT